MISLLKKLVFSIALPYSYLCAMAASPYVIDKIGIERGLSDNYVLSIVQDRDGFMWFGTERGMNRFDGHSFKCYKTNYPNDNTLSNNGINILLSDTVDNKIWIGTKGGGLNVLDCYTYEFKQYPIYCDRKNATRAAGITDMCFAEDGNIWLATYNNGLKKLNKKNDSIIHLDELDIPELRNYKIRSLADDHKGNLYIGHWGEGMSIYSTKNKTVKNFRYDPNNPDGIPGEVVVDIHIDSKGNVWVGTHTGLALYFPDKQKFSTFKKNKDDVNGLSDTDIYSFSEIDGKLWIGTWRGGINIIDLEKADLNNLDKVNFEHIGYNDFATGLSSPSITNILKDSFGNIWMGTYGEGINVISHIKPYFNTLAYNPIKGDKNGLSDKDVTSLCYDRFDRQLWVGTRNGAIDIYVRDKQGTRFDKVRNINMGNDVLFSLVDSKGNIWISVDRVGLMLYDKDKKVFETIKLHENKIPLTYISCIYEDREHNIWVGSFQNIVKYNPVTKKTVELDGQKIRLTNNLIRSICQDVNGNIWFGSGIDGISIVTPDFELIGHLGMGEGFISNQINHLFNDSSGRVWASTDNGLALFASVAAGKYDFEAIGNDILPDIDIRAVAEGSKDELWIASKNSISKLSVSNRTIDNYDYHDGIPWSTFRGNTVAKTTDGIIFFGSQNGVCHFNSASSFSKYNLPDVKITDFKIYSPEINRTANTIDIPPASRIGLKYNRNTFTIGFNVLDYTLKDKVEYAYMLKGIDNIWYQTNGQNEVTFRNLPYGKYTFYLKSRIRNQGWSDHITSMQIDIAPPLWLSWWAKVFYLLIALGIIMAIIVFYKRRFDLENQLYLEKQNLRQQQELNDEKLRFYTNITHELRTPLTLIIGPLEDLISDKSADPKYNKTISLIHQNAMRLYSLINQIMEFRKSETNNRTLNVVYGDISSLIEEIVLKYKELNKNKDVSINMYTEAEPEIYYDREAVTIILDNLISNALKYTRQGSISVILRETIANNEQYAEIEVSDTGYGMPEDALKRIFDRYYQVKGDHQVYGSGIGLALVKNMVNLHEGSIDVKSKLNEGTSFFLRLKVNNTYPDAIHTETEKAGAKEKTHTASVMLIVEDNKDIRDYIAGSFADMFEVMTANDGQEGLQLATENIPDIIVSDIMMPIMDGIEMVKRVKEDMRTSHIPIILLTAKDSEKDKTEGYSIGADSYITKPFSANLLRTRVDNLLQARKKISDYFATNTYKTAIASNALAQLDNEFVQKTISIIEDNMESEQISVAFLAEQLHMSYSTFYRKLKALTGMTANELIRKIKMQHAEQLILSRKYTISEVVYQVGYSSMAYFREAFKTEFGIVPSQYIKDIEKKIKG